jgi:septal ring factor EnvC (AmiA/AmiB activator)
MRLRWLLLGLWLSPLGAQPMLATPDPVRAAREAELEQRLGQLRADIAALKPELAERTAAVDQALGELRRLERSINEREARLRQLGEEAKASEDRLGALARERERLEQELGRERSALQQAWVRQLAWRDQHPVKLLLAQDQLSAASRVLAWQDYFAAQRRQRAARVEQLVAEIDAVRDDAEAARMALEALREREAEQLEALKADRGQRASVLASLRESLRDTEQRLSALSQDEGEVQALLASLRDALSDIPLLLPGDQPFASQRGRLPWPAQGRVLQAFGQADGNGRASSGWRIEAARNAGIQAVARGRVAFADWLRGYGLLLIVDHGDGYMSLYGQCESLLKAEGEWVEAGERIATVGDSGAAGSVALYFEIRQQGRAVDPSVWLAPRR